jgi:hypothetical protein
MFEKYLHDMDLSELLQIMFNGGYCNPDIGVEVEQVKGT